MAKAQNEKAKDPKTTSDFIMVKVTDIIGPYPWKEEHEKISSLRAEGGLQSLMLDIELNGFGKQHAISLVMLDKAPDHVKGDFKPGYYVISGRNRWEASRGLGTIEEIPAFNLDLKKFPTYEKLALEAVTDNIQQKLIAQKNEQKKPKEDELKEAEVETQTSEALAKAGEALRKAVLDKDLDLAYLRHIKLELMGHDPERGRKIAQLKGTLGQTKDEEKKSQLSDLIAKHSFFMQFPCQMF